MLAEDSVLIREMMKCAECLQYLIEKGDSDYSFDGVSIEKAKFMFDAAKRGLKIVGNMRPGEERAYHSKRIMIRMNKIRGYLQSQLKKQSNTFKESFQHDRRVESFLFDTSNYDVFMAEASKEYTRNKAYIDHNTDYQKYADIAPESTEKKRDLKKKLDAKLEAKRLKKEEDDMWEAADVSSFKAFLVDSVRDPSKKPAINNLVAKHADKSNKAVVFDDRKKSAKRGKVKHPKQWMTD